MIDAKPISTPLDPSIQLKAEGGKSADQNLFRQMIGSIMYLMIGTRPDLAAAVSIISQFLANSMQEHHHALKQLLRYIKGTANYKLCLGCDQDLRLISFSDANWRRDINTRRSTTEYIFNLSGGA